MKTKRRVITADSKRRNHSFIAIVIAASSIGFVYLFLSYPIFEFEASTKLSVITAVIVITVLMLVVLIYRRPHRLVCRVQIRTMDKQQRRFIRRVKRRWISACRDSGISREERDPEYLTVHVPRIIDIQAVPLGIELSVQSLPGQPAEDIAKHAEHLASALGSWFRAEVIGPTKCRITAELNDPLKGIRKAGSSTSTNIVIGRCDDGTDALIDVIEASHIALQGMTRSGKSALCYTIFGQLIASDAVRVTGIDPNRVLLEPLAQTASTNTNDFVLGVDPVSALGLLDETCRVMDERAQLLTEWGIPQHENFSSEFRVRVVLLEEYAGLIRQAIAHDEGVKAADKVAPKIKQRVGRLVSEGAKAGIRVLLITQRMDASIVDGDSRGQFGTRITMAVDNGDAVRMLHPQVTPEIVQKVVEFPVGRCLFWRHRKESFMQADFTPYDEYRSRLGLDPVPEVSLSVDESIR